MNTAPRSGVWVREELLQLLTLSGTLAGLCITGLSVFHAVGKTSLPRTLVDDLLAISALLFLFCTHAMFFCLRTRREAVARALERVSDVLFLLGLTGMVASGMLMVYTIV